MKIDNYKFIHQWDKKFNTNLDSHNTLILVFSSLNDALLQSQLNELRKNFPNSIIAGASTSGEICQDEISDESIVVSVIQFENTRISLTSTQINSNDSFQRGIDAAQKLIADDLKLIFVLSDGLIINGSKLTKGITSVLPEGVVVTGGLAADNGAFDKTWVLIGDKPQSGCATMIGFYGEAINISHGSNGGWDKLGLERIVTRSKDNVVYEFDGMPALALYKKYLGEMAEGLPSTGLLFPLLIKNNRNINESYVRTTIGIDEDEQSITFAGDIPEGSFATLMMANKDRLIEGSIGASKMLNFDKNKGEQILTIAISCFGRRMALKHRTEEELEGCLDILPDNTKQIGFYSYGEISPQACGKPDFHNQTMTITSLWES